MVDKYTKFSQIKKPGRLGAGRAEYSKVRFVVRDVKKNLFKNAVKTAEIL